MTTQEETTAAATTTTTGPLTGPKRSKRSDGTGKRRRTNKLKFPGITSPRNACQLFVRHMSQENKSKGLPAQSATQIVKLWKETINKDEWEEKAKQDKKRYWDEVKNEFPEEWKKLQNKRKKRSTPAFFIWLHTNKTTIPELDGKSYPEVLKFMGERWKTLSVDEKKPWEDRSKEEQAQLNAAAAASA